MKIKSMLIASAASLFTVSGAVAADAVVAVDPEPAEYVQICDAYEGFYMIPGSEVCLDISGRVRVQFDYNSVVRDFEQDVDMRIDFDARHETEWGTVRSFIRIGNGLVNGAPVSIATNAAGAVTGVSLFGGVSVERAFISVQPNENVTITTGRAGSLYYREEIDSNQIKFQYAGNGFALGLAYEDAALSGPNTKSFGGANDAIIGQVSYSASGFSIYGELAYEGREAGATVTTYAANIGAGYDGGNWDIGVEYEWFRGASAFEVVGCPAGKLDELAIILGVDITDKLTASSDWDYYGNNQGWAVANTLAYSVSSNFSVEAELDYTSRRARSATATVGVWELGLDFVATF